MELVSVYTSVRLLCICVDLASGKLGSPRMSSPAMDFLDFILELQKEQILRWERENEATERAEALSLK